jgi:hypothetical protein
MADVILNLVDMSVFRELIAMPLRDLFNKIENQTLRSKRPELDARFHRDFDVDLEGDILEWSDKDLTLDISKPIIMQTISPLELAELGILLAKWSSKSEWKCWEARLFLYVEPLLTISLDESDDFLSFSTWNNFANALSLTDKKSYSESVVLDWMTRREELGETMEPSEDPRILPTMQAHKSASESLHIFFNNLHSKDISLLIGREYLESTFWTINGVSLTKEMVIKND